jgi:hypothetical protein
MTIPSPLRINAQAERIARVLGMRLSAKRLPGKAKANVHGVLSVARVNPSLNLRAELDAACKDIQPEEERQYLTVRVILENLWLITPGTSLERDVRRYLQHCYLSCKTANPERFTHLRELLIEAQKSSFPIVRRMAGDVRAAEPVDAKEVELLGNDCVPHDVRRAIAQRVITLEEKLDHLPAVFDYLVRIIPLSENTDSDPELREGVQSILKLLEMKQSEAVLGKLFAAYIRYESDGAVAGRFLQLLGMYGDPLVEPLVQAYKTNPAQRRPCARLLHHMVEHFRSDRAAEELLNLMGEATGEELASLTKDFLHVGQRLVYKSQSINLPGVLRAVFLDAAHRYEKEHNNVLRSLSAQLKALPWGERLRPEVITRYLEGKADENEKRWIRWCTQEGYTQLAEAAVNDQNAPEVRKRALEIIGEMKSSHARTFAPHLAWSVYCDSLDSFVKSAALRARVASKKPLSEEERKRIYDDWQVATPELKKVIEELKPKLFSTSILDLR